MAGSPPASRVALAGVAAGAAAAAVFGSAAFAVGPAGPAAGPVLSSRLRGAAAPGVSGPAANAASSGSSSVAALSLGSVVVAVAVAGRKQRVGAKRAAKVARQQAASSSVATATLKDFSNSLPECPATIWKADNIDIDNLPPVTTTGPLIIDALELGDALQNNSNSNKDTELQWFKAQRSKIMAQLQDHGAILFRNFDTTQDATGFRAFYDSLELNPCLDPIHTSGLRKMEHKKDAVYEAVNKPSLAQHLVGLHNESTCVKTATYGAFVCFKPADEGGGEFLLADGAAIINDMDKDVLRRVYTDKIRISVSNLDLNFIGALPDEYKEKTASWFQDLILKTVAPKFDMDLEMIYGTDKSNPYRLQAIEHAQSPINTHPVTGQPVWFCNIHNHSRYLRDRRPCTVPEVGMTDVYKGDLSPIDYNDVAHINTVCERNIKRILMQKGDVILLDNYRVLHGRDVFKGERMHAVTWFESCGKDNVRAGETKAKTDDFMNSIINKTI